MIIRPYVCLPPLFAALILMPACGKQAPPVATSEVASENSVAARDASSQVPQADTQTGQAAAVDKLGESAPVEFRTVEWQDLMPKEDLDALLAPPEYLDNIADGSTQDQIGGQLKNTLQAAADDPYQQALVSTKVKAELDGQAIRIPGFIVPLEFDDDEVISQFFLVPFFGACIHVPPPAPNQIILVDAPDGIKLEVLYDPFWISGVLTTTLSENDIAVSAYSMKMFEFEAYSNADTGL